MIVPLGRLKQERAGPVIDLLKNRDRSFVVSNKLGIDRDQISLPGKFGKFLLRWEKWDRGHGWHGAAEAQGVRVSQGQLACRRSLDMPAARNLGRANFI